MSLYDFLAELREEHNSPDLVDAVVDHMERNEWVTIWQEQGEDEFWISIQEETSEEED